MLRMIPRRIPSLQLGWFEGRLFLYPKDVEGDFISLISRGEWSYFFKICLIYYMSYYESTINILFTLFVQFSLTLSPFLSSSVFPSEVPDPFYTDRVAFATIPRDWLEEFFGSLFKTWHPGSFRFTCLSRRFFLRHLQWCFFHLQNLFFYIVFFLRLFCWMYYSPFRPMCFCFQSL